ncbi:MAG: GNAT family N-acetyltransferase [Dehalococcoidales bacterium]|nr:GNAT family N-acetyltransferase [Dehalococcoidales bacterium]
MAQGNVVAYPARYITEAVLKDGSLIRIRPIKQSDTEAWFEFARNISSETGYRGSRHIPKEMKLEDAIRYCVVDYDNTMAFVGEVTQDGRKKIVATGRYYRLPQRNRAEVTLIMIEDGYRGKGVGTKLLEAMVSYARNQGITHFEGEIAAENKEMMSVYTGYGFHIDSELTSDQYHIRLPISRTARVTQKEEARERVSIVNSLATILSPQSVAVIGASRDTNSLGNIVLRCILQNGYTGVVYPVNPKASSIMSVRAYPSILDVPDKVDLAIILVPAPLVSRVADECGRKGVRSLIVISDGFRERDAEGAAREEELKDIALGYGMRIIGPNCMGIINTDPKISLNATFSPTYPPQGNVGFISQSGAMGLTILKNAHDLNIGISTFFSMGNRADLSGVDFLQYWEKDPVTKVILLYMESFGDSRQFARVARRVTAKKPIVVVKSGSTAAGSRAAASHTGALATSDVASDVLFRHAGIIRVNAMEELFDVASFLSTQPLPQGRRLAILTNGGGPGIIAADAASNNGLELPELSQETVNKIKNVIKRDISISNPIDTTAGASGADFEAILRILAADKNIDAVLTIFIPPFLQTEDDMGLIIKRVAPLFWKCKKPLLSCSLGSRGFKGQLRFKGRAVPNFSFPEEAVGALARAVQYAEMRRKPQGTIPKFHDIQREKAQKLILNIMARTSERPLWMGAEDISELLGYYGINSAGAKPARTAKEAAAIAAKIGFPVAVKLASSTITHKTDVGGVVIDVDSEEKVIEACNGIESRLAAIGRQNEMEGVLVQKMVKGGIETIVGVTHDPSFGPLMMFGSGGIYAEMAKDVTLKLHPLTTIDASDMIRSVKIAKMFDGFRGAPPSDTAAIEALLLRVSAMVEDIPEIAELDLNPVKVMPKGEGYWVIDARILLK